MPRVLTKGMHFMAKDSEKLHMPLKDELLDHIQDIRDELRQVREYSERQHYELIQIDSIKAAIADAAKDITHSIDFLGKELVANLAPPSSARQDASTRSGPCQGYGKAN